MAALVRFRGDVYYQVDERAAIGGRYEASDTLLQTY
jgi:hypothetical protein